MEKKLNMELVIREINDREDYVVVAVFANDAYGDDELVMSFQPDLASALVYVQDMCGQGYRIHFVADKDSANPTKVKEDTAILKDFEDFMKE